MASIALDACALADAELSAVPLYRLTRRALRARIVGPAEDFEYVSTTAPVEPPITS